jgi:hypothetical protein
MLRMSPDRHTLARDPGANGREARLGRMARGAYIRARGDGRLAGARTRPRCGRRQQGALQAIYTATSSTQVTSECSLELLSESHDLGEDPGRAKPAIQRVMDTCALSNMLGPVTSCTVHADAVLRCHEANRYRPRRGARVRTATDPWRCASAPEGGWALVWPLVGLVEDHQHRRRGDRRAPRTR